jgi:hypothetical protein
MTEPKRKSTDSTAALSRGNRANTERGLPFKWAQTGCASAGLGIPQRNKDGKKAGLNPAEKLGETGEAISQRFW